MAVMGESIQERRGHLGVAEHAGPFREAQVRGNDHADVFIQFGQQVKQQCTTRLGKRQIPKFIENNGYFCPSPEIVKSA